MSLLKVNLEFEFMTVTILMQLLFNDGSANSNEKILFVDTYVHETSTNMLLDSKYY